MRYNNLMKVVAVPRGVLAIIIALCAFVTPSFTLAAEVPVKDATLIAEFKKYVTTFNTQLDATKDLIAGANPPKAACKTTKMAAAEPYATGAWTDAINQPNSSISNKIEPTINDSASLQCLMKELVEWEKLGLSLQIHSMLKTYIADAQTKQLSNQLSNKIAAANLKWAKSGNVINDNGAILTEAVYTTNAPQSIYSAKRRQLDDIADKAAADPTSGNAAGSLGICEPWRLPATSDMVRENQLDVEDPANTTQSRTQCPLADPKDFGKFSDSFNGPNGGSKMFLFMLQNDASNPLGTSKLLSDEAEGNLARQEERTKTEFADSGSRPMIECSGRPDDPYCNDYTITTPAFKNEDTVISAANQGDDQVASGDTTDGTAAQSAEQQSQEINAKGLVNYDETSLATSKTAVNDLIREFYDIVDIGYFGVSSDSTDWARATMMMIYDEMKFDPVKPEIVVTKNGTDPDPIEI